MKFKEYSRYKNRKQSEEDSNPIAVYHCNSIKSSLYRGLTNGIDLEVGKFYTAPGSNSKACLIKIVGKYPWSFLYYGELVDDNDGKYCAWTEIDEYEFNNLVKNVINKYHENSVYQFFESEYK